MCIVVFVLLDVSFDLFMIFIYPFYFGDDRFAVTSMISPLDYSWEFKQSFLWLFWTLPWYFSY